MSDNESIPLTPNPQELKISYVAEPTLAEFHASDAFIRGVMGPIGSGKSVGCVAEILHRCRSQKVGQDGKRRSRWAVIRNTYPQLRTTTINTWIDWMPQEIAPIVFRSPIECNMNFPLDDGTQLEAQILFVSMDRPQDVRKVLSLELTGVWVNEAREVAKAIIDAVNSRIGRYPSKRDGGSAWSGMIMDTNPPDDGHWWYRAAELNEWENDQELDLDELANFLPEDADLDEYRKILEEIQEHDAFKQKSFEFFRQPGALLPVADSQGNVTKYIPNPAAENVRNHDLGYIYWLRQLTGKSPEWIAAYILGEYSNLFDGKPVYNKMYRDSVHLSKIELGIYRTRPIYLGWDFGLTPSCVIAQVAPTGQLRALRECVCADGALEQFVTDTVWPLLRDDFAGLQMFSYGDPAGNQRAQTDEKTCINLLRELGIPTLAANPSNSFIARRQAVISWLQRHLAGKPGLIIDPRCVMLRRGFNGGYHFKLMQVSGDDRWKEVPEKNIYSHVHDAFQYLCQGVNLQIAKAAAQQQSGGGNQSSGGGWGGV